MSSGAIEAHLADEAATERLGRALAAQLQAGDVLLLSGEIGAGKTHLARALIRARLGAEVAVPSPSFTLVQPYEAEPPIWHVDLYRVTDASELVELGLDDVVASHLLLIEWPDRAAGWPDEALTLTLGPEGAGRHMSLSWAMGDWSTRLAGLTREAGLDG